MVDLIGSVPLYFWLPLGMVVAGMAIGFLLDWFDPLGYGMFSDAFLIGAVLIGIFLLPAAGVMAALSLGAVQAYVGLAMTGAILLAAGNALSA